MKATLRLLCLAGLITSACTLDSLDESSRSLTETDLFIVSQVVAESLSDQGDGLMASLFDAFEIPSEEGFMKIDHTKKPLISSSATQNLSAYTYSYYPETGVHAVSFIRNKAVGSRKLYVEADLEYVYYGINGDFIEAPNQDRDNISMLIYSELRSGSVTGDDSHITYDVRENNMIIEGLAGNSNYVTINGEHFGEGTITGFTPDSTKFHRNYSIKVDFLDVKADKNTIDKYTDIEKGLSGALAYEASLTGNGLPVNISGTIQLSGDGTALLKFKNESEVRTLKLKDGKVLGNNEFGGLIASLNLQAGFVTLSNNQRIQFGSETLINQSGDYLSLEDVQNALNEGVKVMAEGRANRIGNSNNFMATEVTFSSEQSVGSIIDLITIEGRVQTVNLQRQTFNLERGVRIRINENTEFVDTGELHSLQDVYTAIRAKKKVTVVGEGKDDPDNRRLILANKLEFRLESD